MTVKIKSKLMHVSGIIDITEVISSWLEQPWTYRDNEQVIIADDLEYINDITLDVDFDVWMSMLDDCYGNSYD